MINNLQNNKIYNFMLKDTYRPASIVNFSKIFKYETISNLTKILNDLVAEGKIKKLDNNRYVVVKDPANDIVDTTQVFLGTINIIKSGSGFVKFLKENNNNQIIEDYYIEKRNINGALNGDVVKVSPLIVPNQLNKEGKVVEIVKRFRDFYVCLVEKNNDIFSLKADDIKMNLPIILDSYENVIVGSKILVQITRYEKDKVYACVSRVIGNVNDPGIDILSVAHENNVKTEFNESTIQYVNNIEFKISDQDRKIRHDLTNWDIVTIDPWDAKDLDDAIYVKKMDNGNYFLSVSIADVSWFVKYGTPLDEEAIKRGTSIYLTDRVIPMLPTKLSNDICSLNQDQERFCITCDIVIDNQGNYVSYDVYPSIIKSKRRFAYDEVNNFFDKKTDFNKELPGVKQSIIVGKELYKILKSKRNAEGYIDFNLKEVKIICDKSGKPIDIKVKEHGLAQDMIESFMIAANEAVVLKMESINKNIIYRVHDKPDDKKVMIMAKFANKLGFNIPVDFKNINPKMVANWINLNKQNPSYDLVIKLLLRAMAKAKYSVNNIGHFGLASQYYTHFTSPIRRYPDLIVHRLFWINLFDKNFLNEEEIIKFNESLPELCLSASFSETIAMETEREVNSMKFAEYMQQFIGKEFDGVVSAVLSFGAFVELPNTIEGLLSVKNLNNDFYNYDEDNLTLIGRNTGKVITIGTKVKVKLLSASKNEKRIEFGLVEIYK